MPVSSLVISLNTEPTKRQQAIDFLGSDPRFTLGEIHDRFLPVVLETDTLGDGVAWVKEKLNEVPGVDYVRVVTVDFSDLEDDGKDFEMKQEKRAKQ